MLAVNYRGSAGRGRKFSWAIAADWGNLEVQDLKAGIDYVIKAGIADPDKLGVGGWSYGGILTDYMIAADDRFKAATSGAGTAFTVAFYGTDQYITQYDYEIGPPWKPKSWEIYQKISYPFLHADRIKTPTLFLGGEKDFNVPVQGGQQMYQALKSLGVDTQLIIYPNENHGISRPSYVRDRYERYLAWYDKYVRKLPVEPKVMVAGWEGTWKGTLVNLPAKPDAPKVEVTMEIGTFPTKDNACGTWKTTFNESGQGRGTSRITSFAAAQERATSTLTKATAFVCRHVSSGTALVTAIQVRRHPARLDDADARRHAGGRDLDRGRQTGGQGRPADGPERHTAN